MFSIKTHRRSFEAEAGLKHVALQILQKRLHYPAYQLRYHYLSGTWSRSRKQPLQHFLYDLLWVRTYCCNTRCIHPGGLMESTIQNHHLRSTTRMWCLHPRFLRRGGYFGIDWENSSLEINGGYLLSWVPLRHKNFEATYVLY